ncbi:MAG: TlpA disulfide reductase family protein [Acidobacteriota bacterium]|nr:TlpA disulfide reductase family protein [Acidobacteriota bacterium]
MATHDDPDLERWVDTRMTALDPDRTGEPETEGALAQLRGRATATRYRPVHAWLMAAGAAALLVAVLATVGGLPQNGSGDLADFWEQEPRSRNLAGDRTLAPPAYEWRSRPSDQEVGSGVALSARGRASAPRLVPVARRAEATGFTLPAMEGGNATLADYGGRVLLLNFWATWCRPCRVEMPWFVEFQDAFAERGLAVLGVSVDDDRDVVRAFLEQSPVDYRVALADTADRLAPFGPITVLPTTWLIDRRGRLAATHVGLVDRAVLESEIQRLLAE